MADNVIPFPRREANDNPTDPSPHQPGLRSFIVYSDELPADCEIFEVEDEGAAPHLYRGDFAVVDTSDTTPMDGELFLIGWQSSDVKQIVEVRRHKGGDLWNAIWDMPDIGRWSDGPYYAPDFQEKLIGRVVGIFEADFRAALRIAA